MLKRKSEEAGECVLGAVNEGALIMPLVTQRRTRAKPFGAAIWERTIKDNQRGRKEDMRLHLQTATLTHTHTHTHAHTLNKPHNLCRH